MGVPNPGSGVQSATILSGEYASTRTIFTLGAGSANIALEFFSPVSMSDMLRQSLPYGYLSVSVSSSSGSSVQIYSDIDSSWLGGTNPAAGSLSFNLTKTSANSIYAWTLSNAIIFSELSDYAQWGWAVFAASSNASMQSGAMATVRGQFTSNGTLSGTQVSWSPGDVTAFAYDLGAVKDTTNVTFVTGYVRNREVQYLNTTRTGYYRSKYNTIAESVDYFFSDFDAANSEGLSVDSAVSSKAVSIAGQNYSDIVTLSVLQTFGGMDITIDFDTLDTSDPLIFLKEISSDGNVNTIDVINPLFPILYVLNPEYIRLLLEPVMRYLATGDWPKNFMIHDIGSNYPNATGHNNGVEEDMPVEESGNIQNLALAYQLATGDKSFTKTYLSLLTKYADYLAVNGEYPAYQLATDDGHGAGANYTNLGIKAAVGLTCFGALTGQSNYTDLGKSFANAIYNQGLGTDANKTHFTVSYGNDSTWNTPFNLFPDVLFNLSTFPSAAVTMENHWYPTVSYEYGWQLDSRALWGKTDWMHWAAATAVAGDDYQPVWDIVINGIHAFLETASVSNSMPFEDRIFVNTGVPGPFRARPVVGAHFSLFALQGANLFSNL